MDDAVLRTVWQQKIKRDRITPLSLPLGQLVNKTLAKRTRQLSSLATIWDELIPSNIREHTALESFSRGTLTVMVDSASHWFNLNTLLKGGLLKEIQARCPLAINKVRRISGQFYTLDPETGARRYAFS